MVIVVVAEAEGAATSPDKLQHSKSFMVRSCLNGCNLTVKMDNGNDVSVYIGVNQSVYRIGDVLAGTGRRWRK